MKSTRTTLNKKCFNAIGAVFAAEVYGRLPFQSKGKIYADLQQAGYVEPFSRIFGAGGHFPVTVSGYALTHAGRYAYCSQRGAEDKGDA